MQCQKQEHFTFKAELPRPDSPGSGIRSEILLTRIPDDLQPTCLPTCTVYTCTWLRSTREAEWFIIRVLSSLSSRDPFETLYSLYGSSYSSQHPTSFSSFLRLSRFFSLSLYFLFSPFFTTMKKFFLKKQWTQCLVIKSFQRYSLFSMFIFWKFNEFVKVDSYTHSDSFYYLKI